MSIRTICFTVCFTLKSFLLIDNFFQLIKVYLFFTFGKNVKAKLEFKKCPYCDEEIKINAKKCKHCGEWLTKIKD